MNKKPRVKVLRPGLRVLDTRTVSPMEKDVDKLYSSAAWVHLVDQIIQERGRRCEDPACHTPNGPGRFTATTSRKSGTVVLSSTSGT